jgi:hypothetical protein
MTNSAPAWLPDWRDPSKYPDPKSIAPLQWAWEFLRRNAEYQADAILANSWPAPPGNVLIGSAELFAKLMSIDTDQTATKAERHEWKHWGELQDAQIAKVAELARKWHLRRGILPDPANPRAWNEDDFELPGHLLSSYAARDYWTGKPGKFMVTPKHPNEIAVVFDLTEPLPAQLKAARGHLLRLKDDYAKRGWIKNRRLRSASPVNLGLYLRVTDAKLVGEKDAEIAKVLFARLSNQHPDYQGSRRVVDAAAEARRLIERGYTNIRIGPSRRI